MKNKPLENIFSVKNEDIHKILTILGIKMKFKNRNNIAKKELENLNSKIIEQNIELTTINDNLSKKVQVLQQEIESTNSRLIQIDLENKKNFINTYQDILFIKYANKPINIEKILLNTKLIYNKCHMDSKNTYLHSLLKISPFYKNIEIPNNPDLYYIWGIREIEQTYNIILQSQNANKMALFFEMGFLWDTYKNKRDEKGISFTIDDLTCYFDATRPSRLELMLNDKNLVISEDQKIRARKCIDKITSTHLTKYNHQPIYTPNIGRKGVKKVLVVDQSYGDMSISKGLANDSTFENMLNTAIQQNPDADIIVKTHPDTIAGAGGYYKNLKAHDNIYLQTEAINPISLIKYCDKVYVATTQLGFEALMCEKEVHVFGMPFYAGWGLTNDAQNCERRENKRSLEEIFYIAYIMYSYYVNPEKESRCEIEEAIDYLLKLRDEYFNEYKIKNKDYTTI